MASGNRALPIENGEVLPAAGGNGEGGNGGSGDGFNRNRSSVDQVRVLRACVTACSVASLPRVSRV